VVLRAHSPELRQVATVGEVLSDQAPEEIRADVRDKRQKQDHMFFQRELATVIEVGELRWLEAVLVEWPRGLRGFRGLAKVPGEALGYERIEAREHEGQVCCTH
jgi:hypothetical protein